MKALILLLCLNVCLGQSNDLQHRKEVLKKFFIEISNNQFDKDKIRKKFIYPIKGERHEERIKLLNEVLTYLNTDLGKKDLSKLDFVPYSELSESEQNLYISENLNDIVTVKYQGEYFLSILFEGDKIRSLISMHKGKQRIIILL